MAVAVPASRSEAFAQLKAGLEAARFTATDPTLLRTGFLELDRALGGGLPRGIITTLEGGASSGASALASRILAVATRQGLAAAIHDDTLFPPALARAGVILERLLVLPASEPRRIARAVDIVLRSRAFGIVLMPAVCLKATVWSRLAGIAHHANALLLVRGEVANELAYFASVRIHCRMARVFWTHASGPFCELAGYEIEADVNKNKRAVPGGKARFQITNTESAALRTRVLA